MEKWQFVFHGFLQPGFPSARSFVNRLVLANRQPVFVNDCEAVERVLPSVDWHDPFLRNVAQSQVEQFRNCLVIGEASLGLPSELKLTNLLLQSFL